MCAIKRIIKILRYLYLFDKGAYKEDE